MNIYVIYKFCDSEKVNALLNEYKKRDKEHVLNFFRFNAEGNNYMWHRKAKKKMQNSNLALYFCSFGKNNKGEAKNVKWELDLANKYRKTVFVFNISDNNADIDITNQFARTIFGIDFSEELLNIRKYKIFNQEDYFDVLMTEARWNIENHVVNKDFDVAKLGESEYYNLLLEEYKVMIDTSEKLMERRQNTSNLYTTLCAAMATVFGASFAFNNWLLVSFIALVTGIVFICLSVNWRACLKAYEMNNNGKFAVINALEKILPANLFDCEYRYNTKNGIKSYSGREKFLPIIFTVLGTLLIIFSIVFLVLERLNII